MRSVLAQPRGRRLFAALLQSRLGTGAAYVALLVVAYHRLHSPWAVSLILLADFLPGIVLAPLFGALADRCPRRVLAVGADLLSAAAFIALALTGSYVATVALALLAGVGTALSGPTLSAAMYDAFGTEHRAATATLRTTVSSLGVTLGPAIAAGLTLLVSPSLVLAINGATFAVSAAIVCTVDLGCAAPRERQGRSLLADVRDGLSIATRTPGLVTLLVLDAASVLAGGVINVAEPVFAIGVLHAGATGYAGMVSAYGVGMVAASWWTARLGTGVPTLRRWWLWGLAIDAVALGATAVAPDLWVALATFALTGAGNAFVFLHGRIVQEVTPTAALGRVYGLRDLGVNVAFTSAFLVAGALISVVGARLTFAAAGASLCVVAVVGATCFVAVTAPPPLLTDAEVAP